MSRINSQCSPNVSTPAAVPGWVKYTIGFAQAQAAVTTNPVSIFVLPAKGYIERVVMNVTQAFAGPLTVTGSIGVVGTVAKYVAITDLTALGVTLDSISLPVFTSISSTASVNLNFVSTVQNLTNLSAGSVDIWFLVSTLP